MNQLVSLAVFFVLLLLLVVMSALKPTRLKQLHWRKLIIIFIWLAAMLGSSYIPSPFYNNGDQVDNRDILFLVDVTYSMNALDGRDKKSRLDDAKKDIVTISQRSPGSRVGIITFDSTSDVYLPLTATASDIEVAANTISTRTYYASQKVMKLSDAMKATGSYIRSSSEIDKTRQKMLIVLSDFELTNKQEKIDETVKAATELKKTVGGAVLIGYGNNTAVKMPVVEYDYTTGETIKNDDYFASGEKDDGSYGDFFTLRSEDNAKQLTKALDGTYVAGENTGEIDSAVNTSAKAALKRQSGTSESRALRQNNLYIFGALGLLVWLTLTEILALPGINKLIAHKPRSKK